LEIETKIINLKQSKSNFCNISLECDYMQKVSIAIGILMKLDAIKTLTAFSLTRNDFQLEQNHV
jgi:hypothetical protein